METSVNNKCRAFTSLEQSKKLAEILPLESADMYHFIDDTDKVGFGYRKITADYYSKTKLEYIPCWSLAALLDVLPNNEYKCTVLSRGRYDTETKKYADEWQVNYNEANGQNRMIIKANNPINACYEMIIKLHELKML